MKIKILLLTIVVFSLILRLYQLSQTPPALNWDETSLGYNAFSIASTLHDEHGELLPVARFMAFGDYKPPGYIYVDALVVKLLGPTEFAVRLPSALAGSLLILLSFFLVQELFYKWPSQNRNLIGLLASFLLAISPWSLQMSRAAFESNLATLFSGLGIYFLLRAFRTSTWSSYLGSSFFFAASMYTFNSHRVFVPLILLFLSLIYLKNILKQPLKYIFFGILLMAFLSPAIPHFLSSEGKLRFNEVTWLNNLDIINQSNTNIISHGNTMLAKILYNRRVYFLGEFLHHYSDNFQPSFLFIHGDPNARLSIETHGLLYPPEIILLLFGLFTLFRHSRQTFLVLVGWWLLAVVPAGIARETPHALRILALLPTLQIISAIGLFELVRHKSYFLPITAFIAVLYAYSTNLYFSNYFLSYPHTYNLDWQDGYKDMVKTVASLQNSYDAISITNHYGRPYIYFLFYNQYSPERYWLNRSAQKDQFGFWSVGHFDKYYFSDPLPNGKILYVRAPLEVPSSAHIIKTIPDINMQPVFILYE